MTATCNKCGGYWMSVRECEKALLATIRQIENSPGSPTAAGRKAQLPRFRENLRRAKATLAEHEAEHEATS